MAITTMDSVVAAMPGQQRRFYLASVAAKAQGSFQSLWTTAGSPGPSATPATGTGAVPLTADGRVRFTNPTSPALTYLSGFRSAGGIIGTITVYDRLWHNSGLSGIVTTAQTVSSLALTRPDATGTDTELWLEIYTATGATAVTATASYTNDAGTASRSATASLVATPVAGQMFPFTLQAGDVGVRSVQSVTLSATTGTAGNFGLTILRRLVDLPQPANVVVAQNIFDTGMPQVYDSAAIGFLCQASTTTVGPFYGSVGFIQG